MLKSHLIIVIDYKKKSILSDRASNRAFQRHIRLKAHRSRIVRQPRVERGAWRRGRGIKSSRRGVGRWRGWCSHIVKYGSRESSRRGAAPRRPPPVASRRFYNDVRAGSTLLVDSHRWRRRREGRFIRAPGLYADRLPTLLSFFSPLGGGRGSDSRGWKALKRAGLSWKPWWRRYESSISGIRTLLLNIRWDSFVIHST